MLRPAIAPGDFQNTAELELQARVVGVGRERKSASAQRVPNVDEPVGDARHGALWIVGIGSVEIAIGDHRAHELDVGRAHWPVLTRNGGYHNYKLNELDTNSPCF